MDYSVLWEQLSHARWNGIVLVWESFLTAAQTNWWMWAVLAFLLITASRKSLIRLLRYIGLSFVRSELR